MSIATTTDSQFMSFGPLHEILKTKNGLWNECPERFVLNTQTPVVKLFVSINLGFISERYLNDQNDPIVNLGIWNELDRRKLESLEPDRRLRNYGQDWSPLLSPQCLGSDERI